MVKGGLGQGHVTGKLGVGGWAILKGSCLQSHAAGKLGAALWLKGP